MKKTVFEGVINGEKFDNVADYNKRLTSLLGSGAKVDAQANTKTVDEDELVESCKGKHCNGANLGEFDLTPEDLTPGFNGEAQEFITHIFENLDDIKLEALEDIDMEALSETLTDDDYLSALNDAINNMSIDELENYFKDLQKIVYMLERSTSKEQLKYNDITKNYSKQTTDLKKYQNAIDELENQLKNLENSYNSLKAEHEKDNLYLSKYLSFDKLSKMFRKFYKPLYDKVYDNIQSAWNYKTEIKEKSPQQEANYVTGLGGDNPEELKKKIEKVSDLLSDTLKSLGLELDASNTEVPTPENAAHLFKDIFGENVANEFLKSINKKKKNK